jgi:hypothetical protein
MGYPQPLNPELAEAPEKLSPPLRAALCAI